MEPDGPTLQSGSFRRLSIVPPGRGLMNREDRRSPRSINPEHLHDLPLAEVDEVAHIGLVREVERVLQRPRARLPTDEWFETEPRLIDVLGHGIDSVMVRMVVRQGFGHPGPEFGIPQDDFAEESPLFVGRMTLAGPDEQRQRPGAGGRVVERDSPRPGIAVHVAQPPEHRIVELLDVRAKQSRDPSKESQGTRSR